jgi:hypothetical protein
MYMHKGKIVASININRLGYGGKREKVGSKRGLKSMVFP